MERLLSSCFVAMLVIALALALCLRNPVRLRGSELFRSYQCLMISLETSSWPSIEDQHFIVKYKRGDEASAQMVLKEAERVYQPLSAYFGYMPDKSVPILIYPDRVSLNRIFGWGSDESAMGVYWAGVIRVLSPRAWMEDPPVNQQQQIFQAQGPVAHEYVHLLVDYKTGGNYPRWLTEGLAQYGEEMVARGEPPDRERIAVTVATIKQLDGRFDDPVWQDYSYAVAKDLVSSLIERYGPERIRNLLDALGSGQPMDKAFAKTYGITLDEYIRSYNGSQC
ncbi:MAG: hypothetical protein ABSC17_03310 [Thermacetogeniaceae bacterium]